jgi:Transposase DDE domain/Insertion element 4 transposase N-terminal
MYFHGKEAARLASWSTRQRLTALKRIIPLKKVKAALRRAGRGQTFCPRTCDGFMVWFVVALGLFCTDCYRQLYRWLVPWKKGDVPGRSTLCEARQRLGVRALVVLAAEVIQLLARPATPGAFYDGLRLMAVDGFKVNLADTPVQDRVFGRPSNGRSPGGFPQAQVLGLVEAGTHVFWRWLIKGCHVEETRMVPPLLQHLQADMLLLWDRGFASFALVRQVVDRGAQLLARWKDNRILQPFRRLTDGSYLAYIYASERDRTARRGGILVRIIEYTLQEPARGGQAEKHRLLTTLLDAQRHPAQTLVELYHVRWEEELAIDELKTHELERPVLRSQTPAGVVQEIYGLMLAHYVLRTLMFTAARRAAVSPLRRSFTGTLKILRCRLPECPPRPKDRDLWWQRLLEEIAEEQIPPRRNRINPRVIKCPQSKWPKKRPCHRQTPQPTRLFRDSIKILR